MQSKISREWLTDHDRNDCVQVVNDVETSDGGVFPLESIHPNPLHQHWVNAAAFPDINIDPSDFILTFELF